MPIPKTADIGEILSFIKREKPNMKKDQRIAIALDMAKKQKKKGKKK
jgi:hypothetical protein